MALPFDREYLDLLWAGGDLSSDPPLGVPGPQSLDVPEWRDVSHPDIEARVREEEAARYLEMLPASLVPHALNPPVALSRALMESESPLAQGAGQMMVSSMGYFNPASHLQGALDEDYAEPYERLKAEGYRHHVEPFVNLAQQAPGLFARSSPMAQAGLLGEALGTGEAPAVPFTPEQEHALLTALTLGGGHAAFGGARALGRRLRPPAPRPAPVAPRPPTRADKLYDLAADPRTPAHEAASARSMYERLTGEPGPVRPVEAPPAAYETLAAEPAAAAAAPKSARVGMREAYAKARPEVVAAPAAEEVPLGISRPPARDVALEGMAPDAFGEHWKNINRHLSGLERRFDEDLALERDPAFRRELAEAQDEWAAADMERFRRDIGSSHPESIFDRLLQLRPNSAEDRMKMQIVVEEMAADPDPNVLRQLEAEFVRYGEQSAKHAEVAKGMLEDIKKAQPAPAPAPGRPALRAAYEAGKPEPVAPEPPPPTQTPAQTGGPHVGPRGGKWVDPQHKTPWMESMSAESVRAHVSAVDKGGKHGHPATVGRVKDVPHIKTTLSLDDLDVIEPGDTRRVAEYAARETPMPAIQGGYNARSHGRGKATVYVPNGNHRVAAAKLRGDTHIEVIMPTADFELWSSRTSPPPPTQTPAQGFLGSYENLTLPHADPRFRTWWVDRDGKLVSSMGGDPKNLSDDTLWGANTVMWKGESSDQGDIHLEFITVNKDFRGHGVGRQILKEIIRMADRENLSVSLEPDARGGQLSSADLDAWYRRYGFETMDHPEYGELEDVLIRAPSPPPPTQTPDKD